MIAALIPALIPLLSDLTKFIPDPAARERHEIALAQLATAADNAQLEVNKVEAANPSVFVAGWRAFIGWVCGFGLGYTFLGAPILAYILTIAAPGMALPVIPTDNLMELVLAMLGLGGLRTFEKIRKASK
jgi:hypothetical protein